MKEIRLLKADEIEVKVKQVTEKGAVLLLYKDARCDMKILDETFGVMNWQDDYKEIKGNLYCGIGARESEDKPYVWKWNCGIESREDDGNEKKGEASDAFKRAGFLWGIGRELYTSPFVFANVPVKTSEFNDKKTYKLANSFEKFRVKEIDYTDKKITKLVIVDSKNAVVYTYGTGKQSTQQTEHQEPVNYTETPKKSNTAHYSGLQCVQCDADVSDKVAKYSTDKFGKVLCFDCQKQAPKAETQTKIVPVEVPEGMPF